ncbi:hypothetical protein TELCIR_15315, partial [Teladorsagia circumcincta]
MSSSSIHSAIGMAGIPVPLVGSASVRIQIGSTSLVHTVYFTGGSCIPRRVDKYNIILGNDLLSRLPSWRINYRLRRFTIGQDNVPILSITPALCDSETPRDGIKIRVAQTSIIPPRSEAIVSCYVASPADTSHPLMLTAQPAAVYRKQLFIAPAVLHPGRAFLLVTNPSSRPEALYEHQQVAAAVPLATDDSGALFEAETDNHGHAKSPLIAVTDRDTTVSHQPLNIGLSQCEVSDAEKAQLYQLFSEFRDRISHSSYDLGSYTHTLVNIKTTTESPPTRFRPPRIPVRFQKELDEHISKLLKAGRIVESDTPWIHNTVLVKKRDGSLRVCLDFRPLNEVTIPDHYPLPRIEDLLVKVAGNKYYTTLDLASGYMQLLMSPQSQEKCGWATHRGHELAYTSYSPADRNIRAVKEFPTPTTAKEVKRFIGMANFFRRFIRNFASIAAPLYELTKDGAKFVWGSRQEEAFLTLRECLISKPCLAYPRDQEFILCTDGSSLAIAFVMSDSVPMGDATEANANGEG